MSNTTSYTRWSLHRFPIRPSTFFLKLIEDTIKDTKRKNIMILGSTPELIDISISSGCEQVVSIDLNKENHLSMLQICKQKKHDNLVFKHQNWLTPDVENIGKYDLIIGDLTHYFLAYPNEWEISLQIIANNLKAKGIFLSRQLCLSIDHANIDFEYLFKTIKLQIIENSNNIEKILLLLSQYKALIAIYCVNESFPNIDIKKCSALTESLKNFCIRTFNSQTYNAIAPLFDSYTESADTKIHPKSIPTLSDLLKSYRQSFDSVNLEYEDANMCSFATYFPYITATQRD